jgi:hypothetical protein
LTAPSDTNGDIDRDAIIAPAAAAAAALDGDGVGVGMSDDDTDDDELTDNDDGVIGATAATTTPSLD